MRIELDGVKNIRDFSEYGFPDCIRSSHLHDITEGDARTLAEDHNLKTVIDLRTGMERDEKPDRVIPGVSYLHIPLFDDTVFGISHEDAADSSAPQSLPDMADLYRVMVTDAHCAGQIRKAIDVVLSPEREGAVLWHCTEGKDRCGLVSALFLMVKGFDYDTILRDYLKTNEVNAPKAEQYYMDVLAKEKNERLAESVRDMILAKKEYLDAAYEGLRNISDALLN